MTNNTITVSQRAREYAANYLEEMGRGALYCREVRNSEHDSGPTVQAFARFESDILQPSEGNEPVAWMYEHPMHAELGCRPIIQTERAIGCVSSDGWIETALYSRHPPPAAHPAKAR